MASSQGNETILHFSSVEDLANCLSAHGINPALWRGISVKQLYEDIEKGETILEEIDGRLLRRVNVVCVHCFHYSQAREPLRLIEKKQILPDGSIRERGYKFVSETMKPLETHHNAAKRALVEELQITDPTLQFQIYPKKQIKIKDSTTYIGLNSRYSVHHYRTEFPARLFKENYIEEEEGITTHFSWELYTQTIWQPDYEKDIDPDNSNPKVSITWEWI